jgi:dCTP deaminase
MPTAEVQGKLPLFPYLSAEAETAEAGRAKGMLPSQEIRRLIADGHIRAYPEVTEQQIQPASLDLRLGDVGYRVQASFIPQKHRLVDRGLVDTGLIMSRIDLTRTTVLEKGCVYIVPLLEQLDLPEDISAQANPKSSTGRLDIFTRLITDYGEAFEAVRAGYTGKLYAEIASRTFTVVVRAGMTLNQLRFIRGKPKPSDRATRALERAVWENEEGGLVYDDGGIAGRALTFKKSIGLSVNLQGSDSSEIVAYKAKRNAPLIDLANLNHYAPGDFWDSCYDPGKRGLILEPGDFYILASKEKVSVPPDWAAEMVSMDQDLGEFRIHYAGFFDPGFGHGSGDVRGTRAVLEVRAHEVPFLIEHGQVMGRLMYLPLLSLPDKVYGKDIGSNYQRQGLALSKHFKKI